MLQNRRAANDKIQKHILYPSLWTHVDVFLVQLHILLHGLQHLHLEPSKLSHGEKQPSQWCSRVAMETVFSNCSLHCQVESEGKCAPSSGLSESILIKQWIKDGPGRPKVLMWGLPLIHHLGKMRMIVFLNMPYYCYKLFCSMFFPRLQSTTSIDIQRLW